MKISQIIPAPFNLYAQFEESPDQYHEARVELLALTDTGDIVGFTADQGHGFDSPCESASNFVGYIRR